MEDQYAKKTFLRSGTGWERRMSTLQSSKSYVPKGGFLYTYTAPLTRPSRLKTPSVSKTSTFNTPKSPPCTSQSNDDENIEVTCPHATRSQNNNKTALESSLQQELDCLKAERASLASLQRRLHVTLTEARQQRHREKQKWEEEMKTFHAAQVQELQRLKKCHKALELQLVAQTNIEYHPREEKKMSDQLREELKVAQETIKSQASRHRATVERLQQRIKGLEESNSELKERLISLEEDRIKAHWGDQVVDDRGNEPQKGGAVHIQQPGHQMTKKEQQFREHFERWRIGEDIVVTKFPNGDVEQQYRSSGMVEYYFSKVDGWQVTHTNGVDVYYSSDGHIEAWLPGGGSVKEILKAGTTLGIRVLPTGQQEFVHINELTPEIRRSVPLLKVPTASR